MAFQGLREFLDLLDKRGQLRRITVPVTRELEITEIADRVVKGPPAQNQALLFERVEGFAMPVLINAFGTAERMAWARSRPGGPVGALGARALARRTEAASASSCAGGPRLAQSL